MERIYLVGYMACGKTTFGKALAERLGWKFIDTDSEIEVAEGMSVARLIESRGIDFFRRRETEELRSTAGISKAVVACGGGTPCQPGNMEFMNASGLTVWLKASPERTAVRVRAAGPTRPLLNNIPDEELSDFISRHIEERRPYYSKAHITFDSEKLETEKEINDSLADFIELAADFLPGPRQ